MAGKASADNSGDILVEFDYQNIIMVDPNKTIDSLGNISERLVDHENLVMYANLEADVVPRTKLAVGISPQNIGDNPNVQQKTISVAKINFLRPTQGDFLTTGYYDELTGKGSLNQQGVNQVKQVYSVDNVKETAYWKQTTNAAEGGKTVDDGLLGITSIRVSTNTSFVPQVSIELEDIQGRALFQLGDDSPYAAFFNMPYCPFYLTLKGYYGQAIRFQLNIKSFNARFNSFSGNYQITVEFVGYKFNILNEILTAHLLATPHMYSQRYTVTTSPTQNAPNNSQSDKSNSKEKQSVSTIGTDNLTVSFASEKGYQKIVEVYSEYKAKGLIPKNFPELTVPQLLTNLENFEQKILNCFPKVNLEPLTNIKVYKTALKQYYDEIIGGQYSWFNTWLNTKPIVLADGLYVFAFKENLNPQAQEQAKGKLNEIVSKNNKSLGENKTLGTLGTDPIKNPITTDSFLITLEDDNSINWEATIQQQTGQLKPTEADIEKMKGFFSKLLSLKTEKYTTGPKAGKLRLIQPSFYTFFSKNQIEQKRFENTIAEMEAEASRKLSDYESKLSAELAAKLETKDCGLGFRPSARNVVAVLMASAEAFIRLLDDVHSKAWEVKYDPTRKLAIQSNKSSAPSSDVVSNVQLSESAMMQNQGLVTSQDPVYPWPQFFVETSENDKRGRFQIKYPADPSVINLTQAWDFQKWPEVEFVEEYMKGLNQKFNAPLAPSPLDNELITNIININAIEFPSNGVAYANKEEIKFFYEIWERQFVTSHYSGFVRVEGDTALTNEIINSNMEAESQNIKESLGVSTPYITMKLKNYDLSADYKKFLENISNSGTGKSYQDFIRDFYVTPYLKALTEDTFSILSLNDIGRIPQKSPKTIGLEAVVKGASNEPIIVDTFPFTVPSWVEQNMNKSQESVDNEVYKTNPVLQVFKQRNVISNFSDVFNYDTNRPVTNFSYLNPTSVGTLDSYNLGLFYETRKPDDYLPTEGKLYGKSPTGNLPENTTTSIFNTPYFVNAILNGVTNDRRGDKNPYIQAAYLFLNSLPLASTRERYKTYGTDETLPYIASCLKKFGAVHKMPYAWVLKFGSVWHRYKKYKESGVDILSSAWKNFDYLENYSPVQSSMTQTYTFTINNIPQSITLQTTTPQGNSIQPGFYPKLINDFNYFYNGYDLYSGYTNEEIQKSVNRGVKIVNITPVLSASKDGIDTSIKTWTVMVPDSIDNSLIGGDVCPPLSNTKSVSYFVMPSFGTTTNQVQSECINNDNTSEVTLVNNKSIYNGSVRMFWEAPNYGYFDTTQVSMPSPDSYMNFIYSDDTEQPPMYINNGNYSSIEEILSVFEKSILDQFEDSFLRFCKPSKNIDLGYQNYGVGIIPTNIDRNFKNFQLLLGSLMTVNSQIGATDNEFITGSITKQSTVVSGGIKSFMEYDVLLRYGNPSNYRRRIFDSLVSWNSIQTVQDPIFFGAYVKGSLPTKKDATTLSQSKANYPKEWIALETEVGFSSILGIKYTNTGSTITDFFVDNDIAFTVDNITLLSPLIKMYATQKYNNSKLNKTTFRTSLVNYLDTMDQFQTNFLNTVLSKLGTELPNQQQLPEKTLKTIIDGSQSKVENYDLFKALNDKWIAGSDYKEKTMFEDIMFLDRASRNIGDTILVDIFDLKNIIRGSIENETMSVYTLIHNILTKNNFTVMPLPAYVNFYNVQDVSGITTQKPEGSLQFANNMWGTFLDVDYRSAGPKMICFYVGLPSAYLSLPKGNFRFRDDGFDMSKPSQVPLLENLQGKTDWAVSNRCVGFNVDIGIRSQNIFYSFSVDMNTGKATSESIQAQVDMIQQASGYNATTQNNGLYNLYKRMSYTCTVTCLGNALLQPTMYFNLRHVPMFYGPYMITDVTHTISQGNFQTQFTGVRQGFFDLPTIDNYLQSINQNLLTQLEAAIVTKKDEPTNKGTTDNSKAANIVQSAGSSKSESSTCTSNLAVSYQSFSESTQVPTEFLTQEEMRNLIVSKTSNEQLQTIIYLICAITSLNQKDKRFSGYRGNFAQITLNNDYGQGSSYFVPTYSCLNVGKTSTTSTSQPIVHFNSNSDFMDFMISRLQSRVSQIQTIGLLKYYACFWPTDNITADYFDKHRADFSQLVDSLKFATKSASEVKLKPLTTTITPTTTVTTVNNLNNTPKPTPSCPPPTITSFSPITGNTGTIITIIGTNLEFTTSVIINEKAVAVQSITILGTTQIKVSVPAGIIPANYRGYIKVITTNGTTQSSNNFTFIP